jgi:hypothetical protein
MLPTRGDKSTWAYRKDNEHVTAKPNLALYRTAGGVLLP